MRLERARRGRPVSSTCVEAIVVAFGRPDLVDRLLAAVTPDIRVVVVDNSSLGAIRAIAGGRGTAYVDPGRNVGFATGVNLGLARLDPDCDVLLLNPDVEIDVATIRTLSAFLHRPGNEIVGAVSPRLLDTDGREQRVVWPFPSPARAWLQAAGLGRVPARQTFVIGAALLVRREALAAVGPFDERFFLYAEEADWQWRARRAGWCSAICPEAVARHVGAASSEDPLTRETLFHAAQETYVRKWRGTAGWHSYRLGTMLGAAGRTVVLRGERRVEAARRTSLYRRGPRRVAKSLRE
jgi:GT2 family glycosyltransferase